MTDVSTAVKLIKEFEGFRTQPYLCPAGVPTIGYGSTTYKSGKKVTLKDPAISEKDADDLLVHFVTKVILPEVTRICPKLSENNNALNAILDFCYNLGSTKFKSSTLAIMINAEDWPKAKEQLMRWVYSGGEVLPGLVRRRKAEAALLPDA